MFYPDLLQKIVETLSPQPTMIQIMSIDGLTMAYHPENPASFIEENGAEANMSMATMWLLSLGERISDVSALGSLRETVVCGSDGILIVIPINDSCLLSAKYKPLPSLDDLLSQLRDAAKIIEEAEKKRANSR
jgi:predicted regulator of Ras-like GTPase activity (Roadblock/LC7/MglB family)